MEKLKAILIVCDGLGDRPVDVLGGRTPLETAVKPNMDTLAKEGICGIMDTIAPGVRPGSAPAHLALLGYDPYRFYVGRGVFEALGMGVCVEEGDIVFRLNFATVDEGWIVRDRRAGRIGEGTRELVEALNKIELPGVELVFKEGVEHRAILVMRGKGLSWRVSDTDPGKNGLRVLNAKPSDESSEARRTASLIDKIVAEAYKVLNYHSINEARRAHGEPPANMILVRGGSFKQYVDAFEDRYGLSAACVAGGMLYKGVARYLGMDVFEVPGATGTYQTDYRAKVNATVSALENHSFAFTHFKPPDLAGEDGNPEGKVDAVEKIDDALKPLLNLDKTLIVITADHSTPCSIKTHSADPVPILIHGPGVRADTVTTFNERAAANGGLGRIRGLDLMPILRDLMDPFMSKYGA